jgi:hypothetical protein
LEDTPLIFEGIDGEPILVKAAENLVQLGNMRGPNKIVEANVMVKVAVKFVKHIMENLF